jgi:hypothetical protein
MSRSYSDDTAGRPRSSGPVLAPMEAARAAEAPRVDTRPPVPEPEFADAAEQENVEYEVDVDDLKQNLLKVTRASVTSAAVVLSRVWLCRVRCMSRVARLAACVCVCTCLACAACAASLTAWCVSRGARHWS